MNFIVEGGSMPRPKNIKELQSLSQRNYEKLLDFVQNLSLKDREKQFPSSMLNRCIADVIYHLYEWHLMFFNWYELGMQNKKPDMPAKGYTWKTCSELNKVIQKKYEGRSLQEALSLLSDSHDRITRIIEDHSNDELFTKKLYKWTGSTSLGAYIISASSSHYDWALKLIRKALKS